jgi:cytochrome P450
MAHYLLKDVFEYLALIQPYGDVVSVPFAGRRFIYLFHPDSVERVLVSHRKNYVKGAMFDRVRLVFGDGLVASEGELWKTQRRRMAPAFQRSHLAPFAQAIAEATCRSLDEITEESVRSIDEDMMALTLEIALQILFGTTPREDKDKVALAFRDVSSWFASATEVLLQLPLWVPTPTNLGFRRGMKQMEEVVSRIIEERREAATPGTDLLGRLLAEPDGEPMDDALLRDEVRTLLLAGHETTALALTYACWLIAGHSEIQEELYQEVSTVAPDRPIRGADFDALVHIGRAFKEALRLYPPAPVITRSPIEPDELGGYEIPAGATLILPIIAIQRDAQFFPEPMQFDPSRWTPEFEEQLPRFAFFPFGGGPRVCIGSHLAMMEGVLILAELIRRFELSRIDDAPLDLLPSITLRPKKVIRLRLQPRSSLED